MCHVTGEKRQPMHPIPAIPAIPVRRTVRSHFGSSHFCYTADRHLIRAAAMWPWHVAMQVSWMQAAMQADFEMAWQYYDQTEHDGPQFEEEENDYYTGHDGFQDIDIAADLLLKADEGLSVVANAIRLAECLQVPLADISDTFTDIKNTPADYHQHYQGDDLELRAANALKQVDELLRQQTGLEAPPLPLGALAELKALQRHAQDVAVLLCSRFIDQSTLHTRHIPPELLSRLNTSFSATSLTDHTLRSRLGNSKTKMFQPGVSYKRTPGERRKAKRDNQRNRAEAADLDDHASPTEARNPAASSSAASSSAASPDFAAGGPTAAASSGDSWEIPSTRLLAPPGLVLPSAPQAAQIDIALELVHYANKGLALIGEINHDDSFCADLAFVKETFTVLRTTPAYCHSVPRGDDLENRTAIALLHINEVLQRRGRGPSLPESPLQKQLRLLQRYAHDLVVLACCRFIPQTILQNKGIPSDLRERLRIAFGSIPSDLRARWKGALEMQEGSSLFSRLTQSKNHVLNLA